MQEYNKSFQRELGGKAGEKRTKQYLKSVAAQGKADWLLYPPNDVHIVKDALSLKTPAFGLGKAGPGVIEKVAAQHQGADLPPVDALVPRRLQGILKHTPEQLTPEQSPPALTHGGSQDTLTAGVSLSTSKLAGAAAGTWAAPEFAAADETDAAAGSVRAHPKRSKLEQRVRIVCTPTSAACCLLVQLCVHALSTPSVLHATGH